MYHSLITTFMSSQPVDVNYTRARLSLPHLWGDLELGLYGPANVMYLGTTVTSDSTKDRDKPAGGKQAGLRGYVFTKFPYCRATEVVHHHLTTIDDMAQKHPNNDSCFKSYKTSTMQGIAAIDSYRQLLNEALANLNKGSYGHLKYHI
ncbi:hypothetical protein EV363DRAFT_1292765 [Boletus edulis]|nr:hypothetical protein EV363DRAFT_1292765 [Boletus edulis]